MLVLTRNEGEWIRVIHTASGHVVRIRVTKIREADGGQPARVNLTFDDNDKNFEFNRPERVFRRPEAPKPGEAPKGGA